MTTARGLIDGLLIAMLTTVVFKAHNPGLALPPEV
jgi:hypothetical protein